MPQRELEAPIKAREGIGDLLCRHERFIRGIIRYHTCDPHISQDLFQDIALTVLTKPQLADLEEEDFRKIIYRTITNRFIDMMRAQKRHTEKLNDYADSYQKKAFYDEPHLQLQEEEETAKMIHIIENHLPQQLKCAVKFRFINLLSLNEISEKMNIQTRSVSRYISVGLKKIRDILCKTYV